MRLSLKVHWLHIWILISFRSTRRVQLPPSPSKSLRWTHKDFVLDDNLFRRHCPWSVKTEYHNLRASTECWSRGMELYVQCWLLDTFYNDVNPPLIGPKTSSCNGEILPLLVRVRHWAFITVNWVPFTELRLAVSSIFTRSLEQNGYAFFLMPVVAVPFMYARQKSFLFTYIMFKFVRHRPCHFFSRQPLPGDIGMCRPARGESVDQVQKLKKKFPLVHPD